jgi:hypothetical protein
LGRGVGLSREIQVAVEKSAEEECSLEGGAQLRLQQGGGGDRVREESVMGAYQFGCLDSALVLALLERAANAAALHLECRLASTIDTACDVIYRSQIFLEVCQYATNTENWHWLAEMTRAAKQLENVQCILVLACIHQ